MGKSTLRKLATITKYGIGTISSRFFGRLNSNKHIFVAAMPKSGSTFLARFFLETTRYRYNNFVYDYKQNNQDLYPLALILASGKKTVSQQHTRATDPNLNLMKTFAIRPVILVRNIYDVVISLHDHIHNLSIKTFLCYMNKSIFEFEKTIQFDMIIDLAIPWYIYFYTSWYDVSINKSIDMYWLSYEELMANKRDVLSDIAAFYNLKLSGKDIESGLDTIQSKKNNTRFNKGISGRGAQMLSAEQKERIINYTKYYPWVDFTSIGL